MVQPLKAVFVLFGWRFVIGIIVRWEGREPFPSDAITTLGNNKAASLQLLSFAKVSSTKDLLNRQTCREYSVSLSSHLTCSSQSGHSAYPSNSGYLLLAADAVLDWRYSGVWDSLLGPLVPTTRGHLA